jgi:hypothetical protein
MAAITGTRAPVAQALPRAIPIFRALLAEGNVTIAVADRKVDYHQADERRRPITTAMAIRAIEADRLGDDGYDAEYPEGITREMVSTIWGYNPRACARGELREQYFAVICNR